MCVVQFLGPSVICTFRHLHSGEKKRVRKQGEYCYGILLMHHPRDRVLALPNTTERLHFHFSLACTGEGNGNPLQHSCLENPRDREACWAAVHGVAQSRTRLTRLSSSSSSSIKKSQQTLTTPRNTCDCEKKK